MRPSALRAAVYRHFDRHGRDLPWRHTRDPYHVFVSEVMLQQTQVSRVLAIYPRFLRRFPTVAALARAPLSAVMAAWQGMGYNRRALALKNAAQEMVRAHGGKVPASREALRALPGIGDATAGSIMAFAFDAPEAFIETNIRSVYIHHFFSDRTDVRDEEILPLVARTLDRAHPRRWYNALMDYGVYLKQTAANPSRKSVSHRRQARFEGSNRQVRGALMKELVHRGPMSLAQACRLPGLDPARCKAMLYALRDEGMLRIKNSRVFL